MNSNELGTILNISPRTIQDKTQKAKEQNQQSIKLNERFFKFEVVKGHYVYEEIFAEVVDTSDTDLSAAWRRASDAQQELASKRLAVVRLYRNRPSGESWQKFLDRIAYKYRDVKPTKSKLFRWLEIVRGCEERGDVPLEWLLDKRGKHANNRSYTEAHYQYVTELFLVNPSRTKIKIHQYLQEEFGKEAPSYSTVMRMIERYRSENVLLSTVAVSPGEANNKLRPAPGNKAENAPYNNAVWEMDGTPVDVICSDGVRYQLSAAIDVYSRRPVVVVTPSANATALAKVFKVGIQKLGIPEAVLLDNGREYRSKTFEYTCSRLKIEQRFTMPYSGWQKPHIERFFGTMTRDLFEELPGYIGHSVADRVIIADRAGYDKKLEAIRKWKAKYRDGDDFAKRFAIKKENVGIDIEMPVSREELEGYIEQWIRKYENRMHRGIKQTPLERWNECAIPTRTISDARVLDVLVGLSEKKKVTKKGVTWKGLSYWHDALYDKVGESIWMLSDDELGYLYIYDLEMKFLCKAEHAESIGKSRADYLAGLKFSKKIEKQIRELRELRYAEPALYKRALEATSVDEEVQVGLEFKSEVVTNVRESVADESVHTQEEQEVLQDERVETVVLNGMPVFASVSERFAWMLENKGLDHGDALTQRLADKHEGLWQIALEEYEQRKAG